MKLSLVPSPRAAILACAALSTLIPAASSSAKLASQREIPSAPPSEFALRSLAADAMTELAARLTNLDRPGGSLIAADTVRVVLLKSRASGASWIRDLDTQWPAFGELPVRIDTSLSRKPDFSYDDLREARANVVWLASPIATKQELSSSEIEDLEKFQSEGGTVLGTGMVFGGGDHGDNRAAGFLFGIDTTKRIFVPDKDPSTKLQARGSAPPPLFRGLPVDTPFEVAPKPWAEREIDRGWDDDQMATGEIVASDLGTGNVVQTLVVGRGMGRGIYFSAPHEIRDPRHPSSGEENDGQLLYNALTFGFTGVGTVGGSVARNGEPFADRSVCLADGPIGCTLEDETDDEGVFFFDEVPAGVYSLQIPNIVDNVQLDDRPGDAGVMIADGAIEINGVAAEGIPVYAVRVDVVPFEFLGPVITDSSGNWSLSIPNVGKWVIWAPGIGVQAVH